MRGTVHEYDHHIGDYTRDTVGLSMIEDGAYRRLMDQCYASELPLPLEKREIYRMARAVSATERKAVDYVLQKYFIKSDSGWTQHRINREIAEYHGKSELARASAVLRWEREREKTRVGHTDANAVQPHSERNANAVIPQCETDAARARRLPPSALPSSELQNRDVGVDVASTPTPPTEKGQVNGAVLKVATSRADTDGAGQQWSHPNYVAATAQTLGISRHQGEDDEAFKDRVYMAVQRRRSGAQA